MLRSSKLAKSKANTMRGNSRIFPDQNAKLTERGWSVVRLWEHDVDDNIAAYVEKVLSLVTAS